jgi:hypothetical protein
VWSNRNVSNPLNETSPFLRSRFPIAACSPSVEAPTCFLGSRASIHRKSQATVLFKHESLRFHPMPPRITKESHRPRVSDRTMSYRLSERITVTLVLVSRNAWRRHHSKMEPQLGGRVSPFRGTKPSNDFLRKTTRRSRVPVQTMGLNAETKKCRHRADGKFCLLRFPFESICPAVLNQNHTGRGFARINAYERTQAVETPASRLPAGVASTRRDRPEKWTVML